MPTLFIAWGVVIGALYFYFERKRLALLIEATRLAQDLPPPYNSILKWYVVFDTRELPDNCRVRGTEILKLMREREALKAGYILAGVVAILAILTLPWIWRTLKVWGQ